MKKLLFIICALTVSAGAAQAQTDKHSVEASDIKLIRTGDQVTVTFTLDAGRKATRNNYNLAVNPVIRSGANERQLPSIVIQGRRAKVTAGRHELATGQRRHQQEPVYMKPGGLLEYSTTLPYESWMRGADLVLDGVSVGCCSSTLTTIGLIADNILYTEPEPEIPEPQFAVSFITPQAEAVKRRSDSGQAYLDFAVGRSEIESSFKGNAAELQKIHGLIKEVKNDPDATITGITITGYASPEGSYQTNLSLSQRRAEALKNHIKVLYGFPESMFAVSGQGEDWAMLDTLVSRSDIADRYAVLEIIRGTGVFDGRERKLMQLSGGVPYRYILANMFPQLRRTDYELHYTVQPFTVEKGKEVFRIKPGNLSLNELFLIANTYDPGSDAFNEVFETAARIFPHDDVANLNASASALDRRDAVSARKYLDRVTEYSAAWWNNSGILAWMEGDADKAAQCFVRARQAGNNEAVRNAAEIDNRNNLKAE